MPRLLLIDDSPDLLAIQLRHTFHADSLDVTTAQDARHGLELSKILQPDVILLDLNLPDQSGLEIFARLREQDARRPIIFITAWPEADSTIRAMRLGAFDFLLKPVKHETLRETVAKALVVSRLSRDSVPDASAATDVLPDAIIGACPQMQDVYKAIGRVSAQDVTVLITGESGTGKELVARAIHKHSKRAAGAFMPINSAAIPESLLESELFGHEKGAFTSADRRRIGRFEQCRDGTLFLDEIGDMPLSIQAKMLRVLQEQQFERVGGNETIRTNVRMLAATNHDLDVLVEQGRFRRDLYHRLNVYTVELPPLRERAADLPVLIKHYLHRCNRELAKEVAQISDDAMVLLQRYAWPGNVRELYSVLRQAVLHTVGIVLLPESLPTTVRANSTGNNAAALDNSSEALTFGISRAPSPGQPNVEALIRFVRDRLADGSTNLYEEVLEQVEQLILPIVLEHTRGNQLQASRLLGLSRNHLRNKLREYGFLEGRFLNRKQFRVSEPVTLATASATD